MTIMGYPTAVPTLGVFVDDDRLIVTMITGLLKHVPTLGVFVVDDRLIVTMITG